MLMNQLEEFQKMHRLSIPECAKIIGVSVQTLYNVREGKSIKMGTLTKIQSVIGDAQHPLHATKLNRLLDGYNAAYQEYHSCLLKEWQGCFAQLDADEHSRLAKLIEEMQRMHTQIVDYHEVVKGIVGRTSSN